MISGAGRLPNHEEGNMYEPQRRYGSEGKRLHAIDCKMNFRKE
jgi:hypothetical protein